MESNVTPRVESGAITVMRLYDVAYAMDLAMVERLASERDGSSATRVRLTRVEPKAIAYSEPPVGLTLGIVRVPLAGGGEVTGIATARAYEFGAVSIAIRVPVQNESWSGFVAFSRSVNAALQGNGQGVWGELMDRMRRVVDPALDRPVESGVEEDYVVTSVQRFDRSLNSDELLESIDIAALLSGETRPLSEQSKRELLRHVFTYYRDDLVALSWDHAFVWDPAGESDVVDVLEVANAQLLELRYYDDLLDDELPRIYDRVEETRGGLASLSRRRFSRLARTIYSRVAEVTEIMERIDNALIVTEDVYLARIYGSALELFRVRTWATGVEKKLELMRDTYRSLYDEAATARAEILEAAIVLLIVLEIVLAFLGWLG
ncbi:MAG TPA: hypothetical protein VK933_08005 [Longimicrobiales bacterium]|nr:hypothetical protein [Longimicrobiales bacterium]